MRPGLIEEDRQITTRQVPFVPPPHYAEREIVLEDSISFRLGTVDFSLIRLPGIAPDTTTPRIRIKTQTNPDTLWATVPAETRIITRTVQQKEMPWWGWVLITALALMLLLALVRR